MVQVYDFTNEWFDTVTPSNDETKIIIPNGQLYGISDVDYRTDGNDLTFQFWNDFELVKEFTITNYLNENYNVQLQIPGYKGELRNYFAKKYNEILGSNNEEVITSKKNKETILALAGDDIIKAGNGVTMISAGEGDDTIITGTSKSSKGVYSFSGDFGIDTIKINDTNNFNLIAFYNENSTSTNLFYQLISVKKEDLTLAVNGLNVEVHVNNEFINGAIVLEDILKYKNGLNSVQFLLDNDDPYTSQSYSSLMEYITENNYYWTDTIDMISKANIGKGDKKDLLNCTSTLNQLLEEKGVEVPQIFFDYTNDWHETITTTEDATTLILPKSVLNNYELDWNFKENDLELLFYAKKTAEVKTITIKDYLTSNDKVQLEIAGKNAGELKPYLTKELGVVFGSNNDDEIRATGKEALIYGLDGNDTIYASEKGVNVIVTENNEHGGGDIIYGGTDKSAKNLYTFSEEFNRNTIITGKDNNFNLITFYDTKIQTGNLFDSLISVTKEDLSFGINGNDVEVTVNKEGLFGTIVFKDILNSQTGLDNVQFLLDRDGDGLYSNFMDYVVANKYQNTDVIDMIAKANMEKGGKKDLADCTLSLTELLREHPELEIPYLELGDENATKGQTIKDSSRNELIHGGSANDKITYSSGIDTIYAGDGNDTITVSKPVTDNNGYTSTEFAPIIETGAGKSDTVKVVNNGAVKEIIANADKTTISLGTNNIIESINFENANSNNTITGKNNVSIDNITMGNGNNNIKLGDEATLSVYAGNGKNTISLGKNANYVDINTGNNDDKITIGAGYKPITINAGDGKNTITLGANAQYYDEDFEKETIINTGNGDDKITVGANAKYIEIQAGAGNNIINVGNDAEHVEIKTGDGNDKITIGKSTNEVLFYSLGNGNDTVTTYAEANYFYFGKGISGTNSEIYGDDVITPNKSSFTELYFDENTEIDYKTNKNDLIITTKLDGEKTGSVTIKNYLSSAYQDAWLSVYEGDNYVDFPTYEFGDKYALKSQTLKSNLFNNILNGGSGNDKITTGGLYDTVYAGDGNDVINANARGYNEIYTGNGNDSIKAGVDTSYTIYAGDGNDTITANKDSHGDIYFTGNYGDDVINLHNDSYNSLYFDEGTDVKFTIKGKDLIVTSSQNGRKTGTVTLKGFATPTYHQSRINIITGSTLVEFPTYEHGDANANKAQTLKSTLFNNYIYGGDYNDKITTGGISNVVMAGDGNDMITTGTDYDTIYAGKGNDTIKAGKDTNNEIYAEEGNDTIITSDDSVSVIYFSGEFGNDILNLSKKDYYNELDFDCEAEDLCFGKSANGRDLIIYCDSGASNGSVTIQNCLKGGYEDVFVSTNSMWEELSNLYNIVNYNDKNPNKVKSDTHNIITAKKGQMLIEGGAYGDAIYAASTTSAFGSSGNDYLYAGSGWSSLAGEQDNDKYYADKAYGFNISRDLTIVNNDEYGALDELIITGQGNSEKLLVLFDVAKTGGDLSEYGNNLYIVTNPNHVEEKGITIRDYFDAGGNNTFGNIKNTTDNKTFNTEVINEITISVQNWLDNTANGKYENAYAALESGDDVKGLIDCYQTFNSEAWV